MIALRLVRLIESHSESLAEGLMRKLEACNKCREIHQISRTEFEERSREVYHDLSEWLTHKTESDIEREYRRIGRRRAEQGVAFSQFYWAFMITKEHLWDFLMKEGVTENPLDLQAGFELGRLIEQFFDRAVYFVAEEYEEVRRTEHFKHSEPAHVL